MEDGEEEEEEAKEEEEEEAGGSEAGDGSDGEEEDVGALLVAELQARLRARNLPVGGRKPELVVRLEQALAGEAAEKADAAGAAALAQAAEETHVADNGAQFVSRTTEGIRRRLLVGKPVSVKHGVDEFGIPKWFLAIVHAFPDFGATGEGSRSFQLRWLDETAPREYTFDANYSDVETVGLLEVLDTEAPVRLLRGTGDDRVWELVDPTAPAAAAVPTAPTDGAAASSTTTTAAAAFSATPAGASATSPSATPASVVDITEPDDVVLHRARNCRAWVSSEFTLSTDATEWLNDSHMAAGAALMEKPAGCAVKHRYPCDAATAARLFDGKAVGRALRRTGRHAIVQSYCAGAHWRKLVISFDEKVLYYAEGGGGELPNGAILSAFKRVLARFGWRCSPVRLRLQHDGHSCGDWSLVTDEAFLAYCDSSSFGDGGFPAFFEEWLRDLGVRDLGAADLRSDTAARAAAAANNATFIAQRRVALRESLFAAATQGTLHYVGAQLEVFLAPGVEANPITFGDSDDDE
jgi:hypothetical protein